MVFLEVLKEQAAEPRGQVRAEGRVVGRAVWARESEVAHFAEEGEDGGASWGLELRKACADVCVVARAEVGAGLAREEARDV